MYHYSRKEIMIPNSTMNQPLLYGVHYWQAISSFRCPKRPCDYRAGFRSSSLPFLHMQLMLRIYFIVNIYCIWIWWS